ncbi:MAG: BatD family protein [Ignavibacteria bacterium]|nr:BatD family protein [Ignavibacteria bacterium]
MRVRTIYIATFMLCSRLISAQDATFEASIDKNPVSLGNQFTLSLTLENAGAGSAKDLQPPDLSKFHIMGGPNQSSSMQFINGVMSSSVTYSYVLQPKELGKFTIGTASIKVGGKVFTTSPLTLEVVKSPPRQKQHAKSSDNLSTQIGDNLFLKASVDRTRVIQGEQINLTFKLYTRVSVTNYGVNKNPALTGFWSEEIENPKNVSLMTEVVNGKQYRVGTVRRMALFPTQSGSLEISPMELETTVKVQDRRSFDPFDSFFRDPFGRTMNYMVKSKPLKIKVEPLPAGAPPSFKGAVGRFAMNTTLDRKSTETNEPVTLKVTISGTGNIKLLESPAVDLPVDFEQYTPKVSEKINRGGKKISGRKSFEYLLIPRYPGGKRIKPVEFSYFDLSKRRYVTLRSEPIELQVEQGVIAAAPSTAGITQEDVRLLSQDIRFIKVANLELSRQGERLYATPVFIVMILFPLAGLSGAVVYSRQRQAIRMDEVGYRNRRAIKVAQKGLRQAEQLLRTGSADASAHKLQFYSEVARAVWKYLGDRLNIQQADMSVDAALIELSRRSVNGEISDALRSLLESCEMARFAPTSFEASAMQKIYDDARKLIIELERTLKSK